MDASAASLAAEWAQSIMAAGNATVSRSEIEELTRQWALELVTAVALPQLEAAARRIGAALVEAHLTQPPVLEATLRVLGAALARNERSDGVLAAIATQYAAALRQTTLVDQEQMTRAIIVAYAKLERSARQSEARFRALFSGAAVGIGISDNRGRVVQANQALADMLGYTVEEMCTLSVPQLTHPSDPPEMWRSYERMATGELDHVRMDKAYFRKDGRVVWTDLTVSLIRDDEGRPQFNVAIMDDITERHTLQAELTYQAQHDPLTGLPNRTVFAERLTQAIRSAGPDTRIGVCYLDLDGFKRINDTLGHDVGDQLLIAIAERLGACTHQHGHLAARMGGDEFVILVEHAHGAEQLEALASAILAAVATPVRAGPHRLRITASLGVVECLALGAKPRDVLKAADVTLYRAKNDGRGRWAMYDPDAVAELVAGYQLCAELPDALERGEFSLVYQPIVGLSHGRVIGLEALVRWNHPRLGLLKPNRFIAAAEETGFIVQLGAHVLREACRQAARWESRPFVSVNLSAAQTHEPTLVDDVAAILAETGLPAARLQLELTESALMSTSGAPLAALEALAALGVSIVIDDFGTGYSNLAYLRRLPVNGIKLPQELVRGLTDPSQPDSSGHADAGSRPDANEQPNVDERIMDALVRLAHAINLTVVAEGVETHHQAERVASLGCDSGQGWLFGSPYPPEDLPKLLGGSG